MSEYRLPDFVIIGAAKAATTWLSYNLSAHPEVLLPSQELHYFSRFHGKSQDWYRAHFRDAQETQLIGEKSASYLADPATPLRLHGLMPRAKLIAQLRNPIERAYSDYCMHYRRGEVSRDIARYLDPERTPIPRLRASPASTVWFCCFAWDFPSRSERRSWRHGACSAS